MLEEQINRDYIAAMKDKDTVRSSTLSFLRAQMKNLMIDSKAEALEDGQVIAVIKKQVKQRQDSIEQYEKGGRADLAQKESKELEILKGYLPQQMTQEELIPLVKETIQETEATGMKDMGKVMKAMGEKTQGRADNKMVSLCVKEALAQL